MRGILLVAPTCADTRLVDRLTGRLGYGHAAIVNDERDPSGALVAIDASMVTGTISRRRLWDITQGASWRLAPIGPAIDHTYRAAAARVGQNYNYRGLLGIQCPGERATCSQLVFECLPLLWQARVQCWRDGWVSPNCLARSFLPAAKPRTESEIEA